MSLADAITATKALQQVIEGAVQRLDSDLTYDKGISLLSVKNDLLLSYLHHLVLLAHFRLSGRSLAAHQDLVQELVRIRVILDKIRPLESKLKYQIDKLVRKVQADTIAEEDVANDPLSFKPNPAAMMSGDGPSGSEGEDEAITTKGSGIYRPPRVAPTPYIDPRKNRKGKEAAIPPSAMLVDLAASAASANDPYAEPTSGLAATPSLGRRREKELDEIDSYEETNMTRLFQTKKQAKKRRDDEARRAGADQRAGFGDLDEFVGALQSGSKRSAAEYDVLRSTKRPRETITLPTDGSAPDLSGKRRKTSAFKRAMQGVQNAKKKRRK